MSSRVRTHVLLLLLSAGLFGAAALVGQTEQFIDRLSFFSAWMLMVLLTAVMLIGPLHVLRTGRVLTNHMLRRDLAIWAGLAGLFHVYFGLEQTMTPSYLTIYVHEALSAPSSAVRDRFFFWGAITGTLAGLILLVPLILSNNISMRLMGQRWWKRLHRSSYILFALTVAHAIFFQMLETRHWFGYAAMAAMIVAVLWWQFRGVAAVRAARRNTNH